MKVIKIVTQRDDKNNLMIAVFTDTHVIISVASEKIVNSLNHEEVELRLLVCESVKEVKLLLKKLGFKNTKYNQLKNKSKFS